MSRKRIGVFGGTFNPIHIGHLVVADEIRVAHELQRIIFIPAAVPPHKATADLAPFEDRFRMIGLAIADNPCFSVDDIEARMTGKSFTVRTLAHFKENNPDWDIFFLLGLDNLREIKTWKDPEALFELARLVVFGRPGYRREGVEDDIASRVLFTEVTSIGVSASQLRDRIKENRTIRYLVPASVEDYIRTKGLYL